MSFPVVFRVYLFTGLEELLPTRLQREEARLNHLVMEQKVVLPFLPLKGMAFSTGLWHATAEEVIYNTVTGLFEIELPSFYEIEKVAESLFSKARIQVRRTDPFLEQGSEAENLEIWKIIEPRILSSIDAMVKDFEAFGFERSSVVDVPTLDKAKRGENV